MPSALYTGTTRAVGMPAAWTCKKPSTFHIWNFALDAAARPDRSPTATSSLFPFLFDTDTPWPRPGSGRKQTRLHVIHGAKKRHERRRRSEDAPRPQTLFDLQCRQSLPPISWLVFRHRGQRQRMISGAGLTDSAVAKWPAPLCPHWHTPSHNEGTPSFRARVLAARVAGRAPLVPTACLWDGRMGLWRGATDPQHDAHAPNFRGLLPTSNSAQERGP